MTGIAPQIFRCDLCEDPISMEEYRVHDGTCHGCALYCRCFDDEDSTFDGDDHDPS